MGIEICVDMLIRMSRIYVFHSINNCTRPEAVSSFIYLPLIYHTAGLAAKTPITSRKIEDSISSQLHADRSDFRIGQVVCLAHTPATHRFAVRSQRLCELAPLANYRSLPIEDVDRYDNPR